jgi:hypothetical protein
MGEEDGEGEQGTGGGSEKEAGGGDWEGEEARYRENHGLRNDPATCGHCFCVREGGSHCCWCGAFFPDVYKKNVLNNFRKKLKAMLEKFPEETKAVIKEMVG